MEKALTVNRWVLILAFAAATLTAAAIWAGISLAGGSSGGAPAGDNGGSGAPPAFVQDTSPQGTQRGHDGRDCPFKDGAGSSSSPSTAL
jgi:hypothetical protein